MTNVALPHEALFQLSGVGVVQTDMATGRFVRANQAFCQMVGYSETELQAMTNAELTYSEDWERDKEGFAALQRGEIEQGTSLSRVQHKDGHEVWLELHITLFREADEVRNIAVVTDVTERKQAEASLNELNETLEQQVHERVGALAVSEARYRALIEASAQTVWTTDAQGRVVEDSPSWRAFTGQSYEAWKGYGWVNAVHPDDRAFAERQWREATTTQSEVDTEFRLFHQESDAYRMTRVRAVPLTAKDGTLQGYVGMNIDIETQQETERAAERSNLRFSQAFALAPIPATISTLDKQETFLEVNDAFLTLTGYAREEVIGKSAFELSMWSSREDQRMLEKAQADGRGFRELELHLNNNEGGVRDVLLSAEVIRTDGHYGYLKMFYDITERKKNDEQMHQAVQSIMNDASWFSQELIGRLNHIRAGGDAKDFEQVDLSAREREVLERIAAGWNNSRIAENLGLQAQTVRNYITNLYDKIGVHSRTEAAVWARERGITGK